MTTSGRRLGVRGKSTLIRRCAPVRPRGPAGACGRVQPEPAAGCSRSLRQGTPEPAAGYKGRRGAASQRSAAAARRGAAAYDEVRRGRTTGPRPRAAFSEPEPGLQPFRGYGRHAELPSGARAERGSRYAPGRRALRGSRTRRRYPQDQQVHVAGRGGGRRVLRADRRGVRAPCRHISSSQRTTAAAAPRCSTSRDGSTNTGTSGGSTGRGGSTNTGSGGGSSSSTGQWQQQYWQRRNQGQWRQSWSRRSLRLPARAAARSRREHRDHAGRRHRYLQRFRHHGDPAGQRAWAAGRTRAPSPTPNWPPWTWPAAGSGPTPSCPG